eukprot:1160690-Pelagomonas_calceolata.AAC.9
MKKSSTGVPKRMLVSCVEVIKNKFLRVENGPRVERTLEPPPVAAATQPQHGACPCGSAAAR